MVRTQRVPDRFDATRSPALALPPGLLDRHRARRSGLEGAPEGASTPADLDAALRWLAASDRVVSDEAARALLEVRERKEYQRHGHARWSTYLRAFIPMTPRWCQQEMRRQRVLAEYQLLAEAWRRGEITKSHLRAVLRVVTPETEEVWLDRARTCTVRRIEEIARTGRMRSREASWSEGATCPDHPSPAPASAGMRARGFASSGDGPIGDAAAVGRDDAVTPGEAASAAVVCSPGCRASSGDDEHSPLPDENDDARPQRRVVMAPPGVAALVAEAVDVARRIAGFQISRGQAVADMAAEVISGLDGRFLTDPEDLPGDSEGGSSRVAAGDRRVPFSLLGDEHDLRREQGHGWEEWHRMREAMARCWDGIDWGPIQVQPEGAPGPEAPAHDRALFWTGLANRIAAVRGRLLRIAEDRFQAGSLGFGGLGQYVRERMGLSLREARDLIRLDRALEDLPVAFRKYASGHLGQRAAWLISRIATPATQRGWTLYAMTHTLRLLEAAVEEAQLRRQTDPAGWRRDGGPPPDEATFADLVHACSLFYERLARSGDPGTDAGAPREQADGLSDPPSRACSSPLPAGGRGPDPSATAGVRFPTGRVEFLLTPDQRLCYEQALAGLRAMAGDRREEWFCLAVMARHFIDCHGDEDRLASGARLRRMLHRKVIARDAWTCRAPECRQRGGLEADHMTPRARGGRDLDENLVALCAADHRFTKHTAGTLSLSGIAPAHVIVRMGERVYLNDRIVDPEIDERDLGEDPWASRAGEAPVIVRPLFAAPSCGAGPPPGSAAATGRFRSGRSAVPPAPSARSAERGGSAR